LNTDKLPNTRKQHISEQEEISEYIILGLRLIKGIKKENFKEEFNIDIYDLCGKEIKKLINLELLEDNEREISLTSKGIDFSNKVFIEFI
jgi:oxygen-independent coproporphyrinogen-3 oxidase